MNIRWLNEDSQTFLSRGYLAEGQTVAERLKVIGDTAEEILRLPGFSDKVQLYISNGWISPSTPIWTNFGTKRGLPISCFGSYVEDSIEGILSTTAEIGMMSKHGGGTSIYMGDVRPRNTPITGNGVSNGSKSFLPLYQTTTNVVSQGGTRRGYIAAYINIDHGDILEWLNIRKEGDDIQHMNWGVNVSTKWLTEMKEGDLEKRKIWAKVIQKRFETGMPYIFFTDNVNDGESTPEVYKGKGVIKASNLCAEICLPSSSTESFVCDLASLNDLYYDEYKDTDCVEVITFLLDAVMTEFICKASKIPNLGKAVEFAKNHRAIGIGRLGYHSLLQSKMIPFESLQARNINITIQKDIFEKSYNASVVLGKMYGVPKALKGIASRRNTTLISLPPTTSTAFILDVSQSIEPLMSNYTVMDLAKIKTEKKNPYLEKLLEKRNQNTDKVWESIMENQGSVLHLDFLSDDEKLVFKKANEIDQNEIIVQAAQRQKYIDQSQSINVFISSDVTVKDVNALLIKAHDMGVKSLYYQRNINKASELARKLSACASCEG